MIAVRIPATPASSCCACGSAHPSRARATLRPHPTEQASRDKEHHVQYRACLYLAAVVGRTGPSFGEIPTARHGRCARQDPRSRRVPTPRAPGRRKVDRCRRDSAACLCLPPAARGLVPSRAAARLLELLAFQALALGGSTSLLVVVGRQLTRSACRHRTVSLLLAGSRLQ